MMSDFEWDSNADGRDRWFLPKPLSWSATRRSWNKAKNRLGEAPALSSDVEKSIINAYFLSQGLQNPCKHTFPIPQESRKKVEEIVFKIKALILIRKKRDEPYDDILELYRSCFGNLFRLSDYDISVLGCAEELNERQIYQLVEAAENLIASHAEDVT